MPFSSTFRTWKSTPLIGVLRLLNIFGDLLTLNLNGGKPSIKLYSAFAMPANPILHINLDEQASFRFVWVGFHLLRPKYLQFFWNRQRFFGLSLTWLPAVSLTQVSFIHYCVIVIPYIGFPFQAW